MELPEACIINILCRTTPVDAAKLSVVSKTFRSAAESDVVWGCFLPSDYDSIISESPSLATAPSKKALYLALSDHPIIIDEGKQSIQLDKKSGKKHYMIAARAITIPWADHDSFWHWTTLPGSRFPEVVELQVVALLRFYSLTDTLALSQNTQYAAYLVFKMINACGFHSQQMELSVSITGGDRKPNAQNTRVLGARVGKPPFDGCIRRTKIVCLDRNSAGWQPSTVRGLQRPTVRSDGWLEIEMGEFFNLSLENKQLRLSVHELNGGNLKSGLYLQGFELRPKEVN